MASVRAGTALAGDAQTFTTVAGDTAIIIGYTSTSTTSPTLTWDGSGVGITQIVLENTINPTSGLWYLNSPSIGAKVLESTNTTALALAVIFVTGGTVRSITGTAKDNHALNDLLSVTPTSQVNDLGFYMAHKASSGAASYTTGESSTSNVATGSRGAWEAGAATSISATYGFAGADSAMSLCGASLVVLAAAGDQAQWFFSQMRDFYRDLTTGRLLPSELRRRYGELVSI